MEKRIKQSFATAKINDYKINTTMCDFYTPVAGDVGVFRMVVPHGNYMIGATGASVSIFEGDLITAAFGDRYATNQYEAYVPEGPVKRCQLIGRGGVAGLVASANPTFRNAAAEMELVGYATDANNRVINTIRPEELTRFNPDAIRGKIILSIGSSMDSGKTTTAANLCAGLSNQGYRPAFIKLTGTAFPKDAQYVHDRGAAFACDFTHFGYPSTFRCDKEVLLDLYQSLVDLVYQNLDADYIVVEIADGILQRETEMLLRDKRFMSTVHSVVLSCGDSLGVLAGLQILEKINIRPIALSGLFTASELLIREVEPYVALPILRAKQLIEGGELTRILRPEQQPDFQIFEEEYAYAA
jgi:hypothetical protein